MFTYIASNGVMQEVDVQLSTALSISIIAPGGVTNTID